MKVLAEKIKKETGQYIPIEDLMARVVAQRFGCMTQQDVATVLESLGEGSAAGEEGRHSKNKNGGREQGRTKSHPDCDSA